MDLWPGYVFVVQTSVTPVKLKICGWRGVSFVSFTHSISSLCLKYDALTNNDATGGGQSSTYQFIEKKPHSQF